MQLRLDAADRLVELLEEGRGPVGVDEAARRLFALRSAPLGLARSLLDEVVTVGLARRLLAGGTPRAGLASLARFFGTAATPCHRALPDAQATAEILIHLLGLAQERGAETLADLAELAAPRIRKVYAKRS